MERRERGKGKGVEVREGEERGRGGGQVSEGEAGREKGVKATLLLSFVFSGRGCGGGERGA